MVFARGKRSCQRRYGMEIMRWSIKSRKAYYYEKEGVFYKPGDAHDLSKKISWMFQSENRLKTLSANVYKKSKQLSWENRALQIIKIVGTQK